ncbi:2-aminoethylphosphonate aminotransferase [Sediminispirochaeta smaragdinae]|uniref:2-aminoethylphosphonate--pyruvate transaminase n=1 Tax=Sediminispirochaeta smaragdinae (strain DSM 11293 / JCM 15392 / SEBR 4228) TaxID=573413 RepID=E1R9Y3_SEDSS|nr:2-aminoethylphosphonate--pyruvate transaminase [Sediminispirochaeta smaragdinae]ADK83302.1 2-aminoethylphosphonate aminotransferase [Sediminispirochaeta smaragdinae DSM 11293]
MTKKRPVILLNPGPVTISDRVRESLQREDMCHREPDFAALMLDVKKRLAAIYEGGSEHFETLVMTGSGTCAVEAMISSLLPADGKLLVISNGVYGERIASMVKTHGKQMVLVKSPWPEPMNLAEAERLLKEDPSITHVSAIHNETTTGRLNDLDALGALCVTYNKPMLLDAVSSFGGERIELEKWNVAALASTANKCIHGIPGLNFVLVRKDLLEQGKSAAATLYLDLFAYYQKQKEGFSPFTQATHVAVALQEALKEFEEAGGWKARNERYRELSVRIRAELDAMGIRRFLKEDEYSSMLSSFHLPEGYSYEELHDELRKENFIIYAGQGGLFHSIFRIANMGDLLDADIDRLLAVFRRLMDSRK